MSGTGISLLGAAFGAVFIAVALFNAGRRWVTWDSGGEIFVQAAENSTCWWGQMRNISTRRQFAYTHFVAHMLLGQQGSCSLMITTYTFPKFECHDEFSFQLGLLLGVVVRNMTACSRNASFPHTQWELNQDTQLSDHLWMSWLWCDLRFICRICVYIIESLKKSMTSRCTGSHMTDDANKVGWSNRNLCLVWSQSPLSMAKRRATWKMLEVLNTLAPLAQGSCFLSPDRVRLFFHQKIAFVSDGCISLLECLSSIDVYCIFREYLLGFLWIESLVSAAAWEFTTIK